ncbi:MAG TPA: hypothetical protein VFF52_26250 [Isosphaeraceae bacterium]|nr:hypothetical protein [Isosphaeraceae bacterium]
MRRVLDRVGAGVCRRSPPGRGAAAGPGSQQGAARRGQARRLEQHRLRRAAWDQHRAGTIVDNGPGVSAGLQDPQSDVEALTRRGLPVLHAARDPADQLGIAIKALRWLTT